MVVAAGFSGIESNHAQQALAKVGDVFVFKFMEIHVWPDTWEKLKHWDMNLMWRSV